MQVPLPLEGFVSQRDDLQARVLVLEDDLHRVVIVVLDLTSIPAAAVQSLKRVVSRATGASPDDVIICASHTFSAPHLPAQAAGDDPEDAVAQSWSVAVHDAAVKAAADSVSRLRPAAMFSALGMSATGACRDVLTRHGWWLGVDNYGPSDHAVRMLRIEDSDARTPIAVLFTQSTPPAVMIDSRHRDGGRVVTSDLAGVACAVVEQHWPGAVALGLLGAAGDQTPVYAAARPQVDDNGSPYRLDIHEDGLALVDILGRSLGRSVVEAVTDLDALALTHITVRRSHVVLPTKRLVPFAELRPTVQERFERTGFTEAPLVLVRIGNLVLVGVQAELSAAIGMSVADRSPFAHTHVVTMVDGAAKYLVDRTGYDRHTYGAMNSMYDAGAAEILADHAVSELQRLLN